MTEFMMLCGSHQFKLRAIDKTVVVEVKRCPVCGKRIKREPFTLVPKNA